MLNDNNRNTRKRSEICSKLKWFKPFSSGSVVDLEQVNVGWEKS